MIVNNLLKRLLLGSRLVFLALSTVTVCATPASLAQNAHVQPALSFRAAAIKSGLVPRLEERKIVVSAGEVWIDDRLVTVPQEVTLEVPPCPTVAVKNEAIHVTAQPLKGPLSATILSHSRSVSDAPMENIVVPNSVRVKASANSATILKPGIDFGLDTKWGAIAKGTANTLKEGQTIYVDYSYRTRRLDTIIVDQGGNVRLIAGSPAKAAPLPPAVPKGSLRLANIYAPPNGDHLSANQFLPIYKSASPVVALDLRKRNRQALANVIRKLETGEKVSVVFWGDSIACGAGASSPDKAFVNLVAAGLKKKYGSATLHCLNAGRSTGTSNMRLTQLKEDVIDKKPDLVVMAFASDAILAKEMIEKTYAEAIGDLKGAGAEVILVNPSFLAPRLFSATSWETVLKRPFYEFIRAKSLTGQVALADVALRWQKLDQEGLTPELLLADQSVSPNNLGHAIYATEILKCFQ